MPRLCQPCLLSQPPPDPPKNPPLPRLDNTLSPRPRRGHSFLIYLHKILPLASSGFAYSANQSTQGFVTRLFFSDPNLLFTDTLLPAGTFPAVLAKVISLVLIAAALGLLFWKRRTEKPLALEISLIILTLLLASPVATIHHFTWAFLPLIVLWSTLLSHPAAFRPWPAISLCLATLLLSLPWPWFFQLFLGHTNCLRMAACNSFLAALLLWVVNLRLIYQTTASQTQK